MEHHQVVAAIIDDWIERNGQQPASAGVRIVSSFEQFLWMLTDAHLLEYSEGCFHVALRDHEHNLRVTKIDQQVDGCYEMTISCLDPRCTYFDKDYVRDPGQLPSREDVPQLT